MRFAGYISSGSRREIFSLERSLFFTNVPSHDRGHRATRAILKLDLSLRRKIRSRPTMGFPIAAVLSYRRSYRGSHTGRLFRNRRTRRRLSTPAPPRLSRQLFSVSLLPSVPHPRAPFAREGRKKEKCGK